MMRFTKNVPFYLFEPNAYAALENVLTSRRTTGGAGVIFLIDHYFRGKTLLQNLPKKDSDLLLFVDSTKEPTTESIDTLTSLIREKNPSLLPDAVIGIGGGCTLDSAKAVSNLLTNGGNAEDYQGWDLVKHPGVYKIGVPTISGTGAEASRTCVMMNERKNLKLGMNSEHTIFDFLIMDPDLTATVPRDQYFYTGMDTYIHCIESLAGRHRHILADAYSREALSLCREVFLSDNMQSAENRTRLMSASYLGGCAIANSYVGLVHPFSAGLSMVFGTHHCLANCIVMNVMDEFYPRESDEFRRMLMHQGATLPKGLCSSLTTEQAERLYQSTIIHEKPLANALGEAFRTVLTKERVIEVFSKM